MNKTSQKRSVALDLVRSVAVFSVIAVHFFLNARYYDVPVEGIRMYVMTIVRTSFTVCVPLFLILSGYLLLHKKPERAYYVTIIRTIGIYILASIVSFIYRFYITKDIPTIAACISRFLSYDLAKYAWYIEMYLGLFLLIPYINILYHALETQQKKQQLVLVLLLVTSLSGVLNNWPGLPFAPNWWLNLYPVTYYVIGAYLREYPLKVKPSISALAALALCIAAGSLNFHLSYGRTFAWGEWQSWGSGILVIMAVLVFHTLTTMDLQGCPQFLSSALAHISDWSLGAYLVSSVFDDKFYSILNSHVSDVHLRFNYFPLMFISVAVCSLALSAVLHFIYTHTFEHLLKMLLKKN